MVHDVGSSNLVNATQSVDETLDLVVRQGMTLAAVAVPALRATRSGFAPGVSPGPAPTGDSVGCCSDWCARQGSNL